MKKYLLLFLLFPTLLFSAGRFNVAATDSNSVKLPPLALDTTRTFYIAIYAKLHAATTQTLYTSRDTTTAYMGSLYYGSTPLSVWWEWGGNGGGYQYRMAGKVDTTAYHWYFFTHQGNGGAGKIDTAYTHIYYDAVKKDSAVSGWGPSGNLGTIPATTKNNYLGSEVLSNKQGKGRFYLQADIVCAFIDTGAPATTNLLTNIVTHNGDMNYYSTLPGYCMGWNFNYYPDGANITTAPAWGKPANNGTIKTDNGTQIWPKSTPAPQTNLVTDPGGIK